MDRLSGSRAERAAERMIHEVQSTARMQRPPRMEPPAWSRGDGAPDHEHEPTLDEPTTLDEPSPLVSARATPATADDPKRSDMARFWDAYDRVESRLAYALTPAEAARVRRATSAHPSRHALYAHPEHAVAAVALVAALVLLLASACPASPSALLFRSSEAVTRALARDGGPRAPPPRPAPPLPRASQQAIDRLLHGMDGR